MRISVLPNRCQGHARCSAMAPDLFPMDESGYNIADRLEIAPVREAEARLAVDSCPELALVIEE